MSSLNLHVRSMLTITTRYTSAQWALLSLITATCTDIMPITQVYGPASRPVLRTSQGNSCPQPEPAVEKDATCDIMRSVGKGNTTVWERFDKMLVRCHGCCTVGVLGEGPWRTAQRNPVCGERIVGVNGK